MLIADDDAGVRNAVSRLLSLSCEVVGYAADIATVFEATMALRPQVVLLDFSLPGGLNGLEVCRRLKTMAPDVNVVIFTACNDPSLRQLAREAGASAFVWKLQPPDDLLLAIQAIVEPERL